MENRTVRRHITCSLGTVVALMIVIGALAFTRHATIERKNARTCAARQANCSTTRA